MTFRPILAIAGAAAALLLPLRAAAPELSVPEPSVVPRNVPVGKTLIIPITGSDADGDPLSFSVSTSHTRINARARTGNPHYKVTVHTDDDGSTPGTPAPFTGEMEFQLFSHAAPQTTGLIAGVAQSGYYDDVLIHRVIPGFVIQGGDKAGTGSGPSPFTIPHEFRPELIYTGRGQLAMANSQGGYQQAYPFNGNSRYSTGSFKATNGTQFFVTLGQPRHLDFKHTLFGQLVRGFDTLDLCAGVKRNADGQAGTSDDDKPATNLKMTGHSVFASRTDAVLLISATRPGPGTVTVTAEDPSGERAALIIPLNAVVDTFNDPPMLFPFAPTVARVGSVPGIVVRSADLESDAITTRFPVRDNFTAQTIYAGLSADNLLATARPNPGAWDLTIGVGAINDPLIDASPVDAMRFHLLEIGVGDKPVVALAENVIAEAGTATGTVTLATFRHGSIRARGTDFIANVNWGDGSALEASTGTNPPVTIVRSTRRPGLFEVRGSHTYARAGTYPLIITLDGPLGATAVVQGRAIVHEPAATIRAEGRDLVHTKDRIDGNRMLATFTDSTPGTDASDYTAVIDWGDGTRKQGVVKRKTGGGFAVYGTHRYTDAERYATAVHIRRSVMPEEAVAWGSITLRGFTGPSYLPPFAKSNISAIWSESPTKVYRGNATDITGSLLLVNGGANNTGKWKLRFWLSNDNKLDAGLDTQVKFGALNRLLSELKLNPLASGAGGTLPLKEFGSSDLTLRLPQGETGAGKYILAQLDYTDPLTDEMPVPKVIPFGPLSGILVSTRTLLVKEGLTDNPLRISSFRVRLDTRPTADVTIPLELVNNLGVPDSTRATLDATQLVFTPENATTEQIVTVTAGDDLKKNTNNNFTIRLKAASSADTRFAAMDAPDIALTIQDNIPGITVTPTTLTVKEGGSGEPLTTATFKVKLGSAPTGAITIPLQIVNASGTADTSRATLDKTQLVINDAAEHVVTVTAVNDTLINGNAVFTIRLNAATGSDSRYAGQNPADVNLTVQDNDTGGISVSPTSLTIKEGDSGEPLRSATFKVQLTPAPTSPVTIPLDIVNNSGTPDTSRATLDLQQLVINDASEHTVTVTSVDDTELNVSGAFTIRVKAATGLDSRFAGQDAADVKLTVQDNETAVVTVSPTTLTIREGDANEPMRSATFTVQLNATPTAPVTIPLQLVNPLGNPDITRATLNVSQLVISDSAQHTVTVTTVDDAVLNGNGAFTIRLTPASSADSRFAGKDPADVALTVEDNEAAAISVTPGAVIIREGDANEPLRTAAFTVKLNGTPSGPVTIPLEILNSFGDPDTSRAVLDVQQLIINNAQEHTVTVTVVDDTDANGTGAFTIRLGTAGSSDARFDGLDPVDVTLTVHDNESDP